MQLKDYDTTTRIEATVVSNGRLTSAASREEVREIELALKTHHFEAQAGQSVGVLAPGQFGQQYHFRLYTLADVPENDANGVVRVRICVRRCNYVDDYSGEEYLGIASNYLCDLTAGASVTITGPYDHPFEIPTESDATIILIGAGTGIAPFRAFVKQLHQQTPAFAGHIWLLHGGRTGLELIYRNEEQNDFAMYIDQETFAAITALSRRPHWTDAIDWQTAIAPRAEEIWKLLQDSQTYVYVAGLESIRNELDQVFSQLAGSEEKWSRRKAELLAGKRWTELLY